MNTLQGIHVIVGANGLEYEVNFSDRRRSLNAEPKVPARRIVDGEPEDLVQWVLYSHAEACLKQVQKPVQPTISMASATDAG